MKPEEIMNAINQMEDDNPVDRWMMRGIHVWPIIRVIISDSLFGFSSKSSASQTVFSVPGKSLTEIISNNVPFLEASLDNFRLARPEKYDAVFLSVAQYRTLLKNHWYDRHCDPIIDQLTDMDKVSFVMEYAANNRFLLPRYRPAFSIQHMIAFTRLKSLMLASSGVKELSRLEGFDNFCRHLALYGVTLKRDYLARAIIYIRLMADYFKSILEPMMPQYAFVACYYGLTSLAYVLACNELQIRSVDIQHGVQGELHFGYGRWHKVPACGYNVLPANFFCWNREDADAINRWSGRTSTHKAVAVGNQWLNAWRRDSDIVQFYDKLFTSNPGFNKFNILIALQLELPNWIFEVIANSPADWTWWVRLHPAIEYGRKVEEAFSVPRDSKVIIKEATELPLPALLRHVSCHVTTNSSVTVEAGYFGVPTILLDETGKQYYRQYIENGQAEYVETGAAFLEVLRRIEKRGRRSITGDLGLNSDSIKDLKFE